MRITIISFKDDNFGDVLIKICFRNLLTSALENLGFSSDSFSLSYMNLKEVEEELLMQSNLICFAGGGLFGLSYLDFNDYLVKIIEIAEKYQIPVIFSSMGINNMDVSDERSYALRGILNSSCIRAFSVRENGELFRKNMRDDLRVAEVCDPAVWTKYVYAKEVSPILNKTQELHTPVIGINVVRGGLFKDNGHPWPMGTQLQFLADVKEMLEEAGLDYCFYTNGSTLDNNTLFALATRYQLPAEKIRLIDSTRELVEAIASFDGVLAMRMHSSIIAYALDIPSVNLLWNEKIAHFYKAIGHEERVLSEESWNASAIKETLLPFVLKRGERGSISEGQQQRKEEYLMTVYTFLRQALKDIFTENDSNAEAAAFAQVSNSFDGAGPDVSDDIADMKFKLCQGMRRYYDQFEKLKDTKAEKKTLEKEKRILQNEQRQLESELAKQKKENEALSGKLKRIESNRVYRFLAGGLRLLKRIKKTVMKG